MTMERRPSATASPPTRGEQLTSLRPGLSRADRATPPTAERAGERATKKRDGAFPVELLFVTGCAAIGLAIFAYLSQLRVGSTHLALWIYLLALGATALVGGVATSLVGEPMDDLPRAGERVGEDLIVVPVSEWNTLHVPSGASPAPVTSRPPVSGAIAPPVSSPSIPQPAPSPPVAARPAVPPTLRVTPAAPVTSTPSVDWREDEPVREPSAARSRDQSAAANLPPPPVVNVSAAPAPKLPVTSTPKQSAVPTTIIPMTPTAKLPVVPTTKALGAVAPIPTGRASPRAPTTPVKPVKGPSKAAPLSNSESRDVQEIIRLLETVAPARPRPPEKPARVGKVPDDSLPCRHCQMPIPADRPWLRCESCGGSLCLDGHVDAAQAGHPGMCPMCRSLLDDSLET
jgi:hypothetical protein